MAKLTARLPRPASNHTLNRVIARGMFINLLLIVLGIIMLSMLEKEVMPLGTLAGAIVGYFTGKGMQKETVKCPVCGTTAAYHSGDQCEVGAKLTRRGR